MSTLLVWSTSTTQAINYIAIHYRATFCGEIRYPNICCRPHDVRNKLQRQAIRNSTKQWDIKLIVIVIGVFVGLTSNRIEFETKNTYHHLPGRRFCLPLNGEWSASIQTSNLLSLTRRNIICQPLDTAIRRRKPNGSDQDHETAQMARRLKNHASPLDTVDSGREPKYTRDRVKFFHSIHPHFWPGRKFLPNQPLSPKRTSSASA